MRAFTDKTILITGSSGFIGHYVLSEFSKQPCRIVRLGSHPYEPLAQWNNIEFQDVIGSLSDVDTWQQALEIHRPEYIIHLAAQTSFYKAEEDPFWEYACNVKPMLALLEACKKIRLSPAIAYTGTVSQYGLTEALPVEPDRNDKPITLHDVHKIAAENYLKLYTERGYVHGVSLRLANVYGPPLALEKNKDRGVVNKIIRHALSGGELQIYGDGSYLRDYIHVKDVACAVIYALASIDQVKGKHWAIGGSKGYTLNELFALIVEHVESFTGNKVSVEHVSEPDGMLEIEKRNFVANTEVFRKLTGWSPQIGFREGIEQTVRYQHKIMHSQ